MIEEQIRASIHDALDIKEPYGLRSRVIAAVPMERRHERRGWTLPSISGEWASTFAALLLTAAIIAALVITRSGSIPGANHHATPAPRWRLSAPEDIAIAPNGTIYISDYVGNRVYRLLGDGTLATVAGGGSRYSGPATESNTFGPAGLAVARNGDLYIADTLGGTIRKVDSHGTLTTVAPMEVATGNLNAPLGIAFDRSGVLYIAGNYNESLGVGVAVNSQVARLNPDGSTTPLNVSAVPPPAPAFYYLAFDSVGNLYVTDRYYLNGNASPPLGGCRIIRITPDQSVSVIAGTGRCGYSGDGALAVDAQLDDPGGIAVDSAGNIYVADSSNHRIRRIDTHGVITTIAGTGVAGHTGDGGPAAKAKLNYLAGLTLKDDRYLYIAENCGCMDPAAYGAVRMIDLKTGLITTVASSDSRVVS